MSTPKTPLMESSGGQHPRQRATRACTMCHSRKVKCDALDVFPCTRCRDAHLQCSLRVSRRGRPRRNRRGASAAQDGQQNAGVSAEDHRNVHPSSIPQPPEPQGLADRDRSRTTALGGSAGEVAEAVENLSGGVSKDIVNQNGVAIMHAAEAGALAYLLKATTQGDDQTPYANYHLQIGAPPSLCVLDGYQQVLSRFDVATRDYLTAKGILDVPEAKLTDYLIQLYFDYIDPHLPLIDKTEFLQNYRAKRVPLILLQCVLYLGSHFASDDRVAGTEWSSRIEMTTSFYDKARLLADFELEHDQMTLVQSFVMLCHHWKNWTQERNPRYWMSRAVNVAVAMGMHRRVQTLRLPRTRERLWRRLGWVVLAKDRFLASSVGAPGLIEPYWTDPYATLEESDFDESSEANKGSYTPSRSPEKVKYSITLIILGKLLGEVLNSFYSIKRRPPSADYLKHLGEQVDHHDRSIPRLADIVPQDSSQMPPSDAILQPLMRAASVSVSLLYHRPSEKHPDPERRTHHREKLLSAAHEMCDIMSYCRAQGLIRFCPSWVVTGLFQSMAVLLAESRDMLAENADTIARLHSSIENLCAMEETWHFAVWIRRLFENAIAKLEEKARQRSCQQEQPERQQQQQQQQQQLQQQQLQQQQLQQQLQRTGNGGDERQDSHQQQQHQSQQQPFTNGSASTAFMGPPSPLFESAKSLFEDVDNLFNWESIDPFLWNQDGFTF